MEVGRQVGEYIIEAAIGGGGMATVYRARHAVLETSHAVKVLDDKFRANPEARRRFLDEARIQSKHLQHPGIVKVTNIIATADVAALVMELVDGGSLERYLDDRKSPLHPSELLDLAMPILAAIAHAHDAGVIHRDIKPANIMLARRDQGRVIPMVTDFGIAKVVDASALRKQSTHADARMGTLSYMSPEQIRKAKDVTTRSDIFSLGAMFYEMVTGTLPFDGDSDFDIMERIVHGACEPLETRADPSLPPNIAAAIRRAMAVDPEQRFPDCRAFAAAMSDVSFSFAGGRSVSARPRSPGMPLGRMVAFTLAAIGAIGAVGYVAFEPDARDAAELEPEPPAFGILPPTPVVVSPPPADAGVDASRDPWDRIANLAGTQGPLFFLADDATHDAKLSQYYDAQTAYLQQLSDEALPPPKLRPKRPALSTDTPSCRGTWLGEIKLDIQGAGPLCGSITIPAGPGFCSGLLVDCIEAKHAFSAAFECSLEDTKYTGSISMHCPFSSRYYSMSARESVRVYLDDHLKYKDVRRPAKPQPQQNR